MSQKGGSSVCEHPCRGTLHSAEASPMLPKSHQAPPGGTLTLALCQNLV